MRRLGSMLLRWLLERGKKEAWCSAFRDTIMVIYVYQSYQDGLVTLLDNVQKGR